MWNISLLYIYIYDCSSLNYWLINVTPVKYGVFKDKNDCPLLYMVGTLARYRPPPIRSHLFSAAWSHAVFSLCHPFSNWSHQVSRWSHPVFSRSSPVFRWSHLVFRGSLLGFSCVVPIAILRVFHPLRSLFHHVFKWFSPIFPSSPL